jgi:hypothetical protein
MKVKSVFKVNVSCATCKKYKTVYVNRLHELESKLGSDWTVISEDEVTHNCNFDKILLKTKGE